MIGRIIVAIAIGAAVWLLCLFLNVVFSAIGIPVLDDIGGFLADYAVVIGAIAGLLAFFTGWNPFGGIRA